MFSFKRLCLALPLLGMLASCSEEINVAAPYKPITVVYGLLDMQDTAQYIRVQRAFMDENMSAIDLAKNPDSSYFRDIQVLLQDFNYPDSMNLPQSAMVGEEVLTRVNLDDEGFPKAEGPFFRTPNYAYKTKRQLLTGHTYRLIVNNSATGESDTAQTPVISPNGFTVSEFLGSAFVNFPALRSDNQFRWNVRPPANAQMFEGIVRFYYVDREGATQTRKSFDYRFASATLANNVIPPPTNIELTTSERSFYSHIREAMGPAPTNVQRYMDSCDLIVWAGGKQLSDYQIINNAQGGITADQIKPIYTNLRSRNKDSKTAYGLFSTRTRVVRNLAPIGNQTLDSLMRNPTMAPLNIQGRSGI